MSAVPPEPTFSDSQSGTAETLPPRLKILVTGATGFVGRHLVGALCERGHDIVAIARHAEKLAEMPWRNKVRFIAADIHAKDFPWATIDHTDLLIHLAWPGLPNYENTFHFLENFPADYRFLRGAVEAGCSRLMVTGTGAEFGMIGGELHEDTITAPISAYGIAKDSLRRSLIHLQKNQPFILQWVRLFHMYGPGQHFHSLLAQLDRAIASEQAFFDMSGGEQLRDYLPVQEVARRLVALSEHAECHGLLHCSSGQPISVRALVEEKIAASNATLQPKLGVFPYPAYEPMAYWGSTGRLGMLLAELDSSGKPGL